MRTPPNAAEQNTLNRIIDLALQSCSGVSREEFFSRRRDRFLTERRDMAMYYARLFGISTPKIGHAFNRDHTAVVKAIQRHRGTWK